MPAGSWNLALGADGAGLVRLTATAPGPPMDVTLPMASRLQVEIPALAESNLLGVLHLIDPSGGMLASLGPGGALSFQETVIGGRATIGAVPAGTWNVQVETPDGRRWNAVAVTDGQREARVRLE